MAYEICGNINPRPPIDIAPRVPITQPEAKSFLELQADEAAATERIARGERIWEITRNLAHGTNVAGGPTWEGSAPSELTVEATAEAAAAAGLFVLGGGDGSFIVGTPVRDPPVEWDWPPPVEIAPSAPQEAAGGIFDQGGWLGLLASARAQAALAGAFSPYQGMKSQWENIRWIALNKSTK